MPTDLLLAAKAHVDDLVRSSRWCVGARCGATAEVPAELAELLETVVERFTEPREAVKRQGLAAANAGGDHVDLELELPLAAADLARNTSARSTRPTPTAGRSGC